MKLKGLFYFLLLFLVFAANTEPSAKQIAQRYMQHYSNANFQDMATLMDPNIRFEDLTFPVNQGGPAIYKGKTSLIGALEDFKQTSKLIRLGFEFESIYASENIVTFIGRVNSLYATSAENQTYQWQARQVSVIQVKNNLVISHSDYVDYANPSEKIIEKNER
ncbi:MAG: hypothetical protein Alis2KO_41660 [Aliiglaciecola sp.]